MKILTLMLIIASCATRPVEYPLTTASEYQIQQNSKNLIARDLAETLWPIVIIPAAGAAIIAK